MSVNQYLNGKLNLIAGAGGAAEDNIVYLTQSEYDALPASKLTNNVEYRILDSGTPTIARNVGYDGSASGIDAVNVQGAIDDLKEDIGTINESLNASFITKDVAQNTTKSCARGAFVEYFSYTPNKDTTVFVFTTTDISPLSNYQGMSFLQLYSTDGSKSYINVSDSKNPYAGGLGGLVLALNHTFIAKAGVTYKIRVQQIMQSASNGNPVSLKTDLFSNVQWTVL